MPLTVGEDALGIAEPTNLRRGSPLWRSIERLWRGLGLQRQFLLAACALLALVATVDGLLQNRLSQDMFIKTSAKTASAYIGGVLTPDLLRRDRLPPEELQAALDRAVAAAGLKNEFERIKIWDTAGKIIYSTVAELEGRTFALDTVRRAALGQIVIAESDPNDDQNRVGSQEQRPLLEVYVPMRAPDGSVVAVGEIHKDPESLYELTSEFTLTSWLIRAAALIVTGLLLYLLVKRAQHTITRQRNLLRTQYAHALQLARQNENLKRAADDARRNAAAANEELLSRIGAEIHDGPIQTLSAAILYVGGAAKAGSALAQKSVQKATELLAGTVSTLRLISTGLILPELDEMSSKEALQLAILRHEQTTGIDVPHTIPVLPHLAHGVKCCLYRIIQEGLNNASRHAPGQRQHVAVTVDAETISVSIQNEGMIPAASTMDDARNRLGLLGARNRVEAFGGTLSLRSDQTTGTTLTARLPLE